MKEQTIKNREAIIKAINEGANTRKKIVDKTKLSYAVVIQCTNKLIEEGIIDKGAIIDGRRKEQDKNKQEVLRAVEQGERTYTEIMNVTEIPYVTVKKHVDELKQEGIVDEKAITDGRKIERMKKKDKSKQKVLRAVEQGARTCTEIMGITGLSRNTVIRYLRELKQEGIIDKGEIINGRRKEQNKNKQKILKAVEQGARTYVEIMDITGLSISALRRNLDELKQEGIIDEKVIIDGRAIENERRKEQSKQKILRAVEQGATTYAKIMKITGLSNNTVRKYLRKLKQEGIIDEKAIIDGRKIERMEKRDKSKQKILEAIGQGASTYAEIENITGLSYDTVRRNMNELKKEGIIDEKTIKDGRIIENERRKEQSKQKILRAIEQGASTYLEIVNITGLHMSTVIRNVNKLKKEGIIDKKAIIDGRKMRKGKTSSKTKQNVIEEKIKAFDKKLRQNSVTATETLNLKNLILNNSSTINANTVEMAIVGILKTGGKDGFKMACNFYDKCIELVDDDKARKMELQRKIKPYLEWHKSRITAR